MWSNKKKWFHTYFRQAYLFLNHSITTSLHYHRPWCLLLNLKDCFCHINFSWIYILTLLLLCTSKYLFMIRVSKIAQKQMWKSKRSPVTVKVVIGVGCGRHALKTLTLISQYKSGACTSILQVICLTVGFNEIIIKKKHKTGKIVGVNSNLSKLPEELNKRAFPKWVGKAGMKGQCGVFLRQHSNPAFLKNKIEKNNKQKKTSLLMNK